MADSRPKQKSYKEMSYHELVFERQRVANLLETNKHPHTQRQNRVYLARIDAMIEEYILHKLG